MTNPTRSPVFVASLLLFCAACSSAPSSPTSPAGGDADAAVDAGAVDAALPGVGEPCQSTPGCAKGAFCNADPACAGGGAGCPMTCWASCEGTGACPAGDWCKLEPFTHQSYCVPRAAAGQPCVVGDRGGVDSCLDDATWCSNGTCVPRIAAGAQCAASGIRNAYQCADGYVCADPSGTMGLACVPARQSGDRCRASEDCAPSLYCDLADIQDSSTWHCAPRVDKGGACVMDYNVTEMCAYPYSCQSGTCL